LHIESTIKNLRWLLENQIELVNQTSQNNLCRSIKLVSLLQRHDSNQSLQWASRLVSLLQRRCQCNDLSTHIALSISELIYLVFLCQLVSLLQRRDSNQSLQWVSWFSSSESALMTRLIVSLLQRYLSSMQWFISTSLYQSANRPILCFCIN